MVTPGHATLRSVMHRDVPLQLRFGSAVDAVTRARIEYAFRTFCAVYELEAIVEGPASSLARAVHYGDSEPAREADVILPAHYRPRTCSAHAPAPRLVALSPNPAYARLGLEYVPAFHGDGRDVDWLGEIFEWISCADEYALTQRDEVGRIPYTAALHGRYNLDPTVPYASVAMFELARILQIERPGSQTAIAASHDLDYLPISFASDLRRLVKNVAIAALVERDPRLVADIVIAALRGALRGRSPLDCIDAMLEGEKKRGITSTANVICRNTCARDANYTLAQVAATLRKLEHSGAELGVHGSYMSLRDGGLGNELEALRAQGFTPCGVRAHWLRYAGDDLFSEVARLGFDYDSTVGFVNRVGFRSGASFVHRPYNFAAEAPYPFFEVPLAIMDGALYTHAREAHASPRSLCDRVLDMTDAFPGGGVSVLWHNAAFEGAQLPRAIGRLYWDLPRPTQRWTTSAQLVNDRRVCFQRAFDAPAVLR